MVTKANLMGLGVNPFIAAIQATEPKLVTGQGGSAASAFQLGPTDFLTCNNASNSGNGIRLPPVGGSTGCLLGDDFILNTQIVGGLTVYGPTGSTISGGSGGALVSGSAGVSISSHTTATFYPVTASSWVCLPGT